VLPTKFQPKIKILVLREIEIQIAVWSIWVLTLENVAYHIVIIKMMALKGSYFRAFMRLDYQFLHVVIWLTWGTRVTASSMYAHPVNSFH